MSQGLTSKELKDENIKIRFRELTYFLDRENIEYFEVSELCRLDKDDWNGPDIVPPPGQYLTNICHTIKFADFLREKWGGPIQVNSGYRPPAYNKMLPNSVEDSPHTYFYALDLVPVNGNIAEFHDFVQPHIKSYVEANKGMPTGLGLYDWGIHIDIGKEYVAHGLHRRWDKRQLTMKDKDDE